MKKQINLVLLAFCFFFVCVGGYSIYRISAIQAGYAAARKEYIEIQEEYKTEKPAWDFTVIEEGVSMPGSPVHVNFDALRRSMNGEICAFKTVRFEECRLQMQHTETACRMQKLLAAC